MGKLDLSHKLNSGYHLRGHGKSLDIILKELNLDKQFAVIEKRENSVKTSIEVYLGTDALLYDSRDDVVIRLSKQNEHLKLTCFHGGYNVQGPRQYAD